MRSLTWCLALLVLLVLAPEVWAQDPRAYGQSSSGPPDGYIPSWIFYWLLGLGSAICGALITALKVLWNKNQEKGAPAGLTAEQTATLAGVHAALGELVQIVKNDLAETREALREQHARNERQQDKMLKLAVRSQRAIEAVANLPVPEIEEEIDADLNGGS